MISGCLALIILLIILIILFAIASTLFYLGLIVSFIFLCYKTYQDYKLYKETGVVSNKLKLECGATIAIFIMFLIGLCYPYSDNSSNNTDTPVVSTNNDSSTDKSNDSSTDKSNDSNTNNQSKSNSIWKEHDLSNSIIYVYNDSYAIMITDISKVQDCIKLTYTFINESNDATSAIWNFHCVPYQNGINLDDNKEYSNHYYKCGNEQTNIKPGVSIDNCWELIPIGDGSDIEIEISIGLWSDAQSIITINPNTLEYTINNK